MDAHGVGATGEHALNEESTPQSYAVTICIKAVIPAVINGEEGVCGGTRYMYEDEYKMRLMVCKAS